VATTQKIGLGSIVWADVHDPISKKNVGEHPALVLTATKDIESGADLRVAVCTTSATRPLPSGWFDIPAGSTGDDTGLPEACVVKATWIEKIPRTAKIRVTGRAPSRVYKQVKNWLANKQRDMIAARTKP
jgi:mRNA-degrading endonuclease toxin of MazEF toxin-antitoxin module